MENQYTCHFDIDVRRNEATIILNAEGHEVVFHFLVPFFSVPSLLYFLLLLWDRKEKTVEVDGLGNAMILTFTREDNTLFLRHRTLPDGTNMTPIIKHYTFNFEKFIKAIDVGYRENIQEQRDKGIIPLEVEEHSHAFAQHVIDEYEEFSKKING